MPVLSVGEVSGLIATGVFVSIRSHLPDAASARTRHLIVRAVNLILPLVFPAILAGFIDEKNTVVAW